MILKVIHNDFELDLSNKEFSIIEENNWLTEKVLSKYTYPIEMDLTLEQLKAINHIHEFNLQDYESLFDVEFNVFGELHDAVLEIESIMGVRAIFQLRYGLEGFPNFDKNLRELPLERVDVQGSIYDHAESIINQTYPDVNYNFPQVIIDSIDTESEQWQFFEGIINNRKAGAFLENEFDVNTNDQVNRNIIQPLPYFMHILKTGFADAGFELAGDILMDAKLLKATNFNLSDFYSSVNINQAEYNLLTDEYTSIYDLNYGIYEHEISFPEPGRYKIAGNVVTRNKGRNRIAKSSFEYLNETIWGEGIYNGIFTDSYKEKFSIIEETIDYNGDGEKLFFYSEQLSYGEVDGEIIEDASVFSITVSLLAKFDANGNAVPTLIAPDEIYLAKCVADQSFGDFVNAVMKLRNYGMDIQGTSVNISKIKDQIESKTEAFDLQLLEVKFPERNFNQGKSFELGYFKYESTEYPQKTIFVDSKGFKISPYVKNDDTQEFMINLLPLPMKKAGEIITAHAFLDEKTKSQIVLYEGLSGNKNVADDAAALNILNIYQDNYESWFNYLLQSISFKWSFRTYYEKIYRLKIKSIVYAYGQYHIIKRLSRKTIWTQDHGMIIESDIETESLD